MRLHLHRGGTAYVRLDHRACVACGACEEACPHDLIRTGHHHAHLTDAARCDGCLACVRSCEHSALKAIDR